MSTRARCEPARLNTFSPNSAVTVAGGGTLDLNGFNQTVSGLTNAGLVNMGTGTAPGTVLTTTSYMGAGGTIAMQHFSRRRRFAIGQARHQRRQRDRQFVVAHHQCGRPRRRDGGEWHHGGAGDQRRHDGARRFHARWRGARAAPSTMISSGAASAAAVPTIGSCARASLVGPPIVPPVVPPGAADPAARAAAARSRCRRASIRSSGRRSRPMAWSSRSPGNWG